MISLVELGTYPSLKYHINNKLSLCENVYRYSSHSFIQLFKEAREAVKTGDIQVFGLDKILLEETDIGEYGEYEGEQVPLDLPMVEIGDVVKCKKCNHYWEREPGDKRSGLCHKCGYDSNLKSYDIEALEDWRRLQEAEYKGKKVSLNKPKRGGPKKFYVYVKNPKTGKVKKVNFGAVDGGQNLSVKISDPKRRKAFSDRHNCPTKKDKTKPGYWACRVNRYWKQLGGNQNYPGYW
jgi:hypothetical protein